ncbi:MAG: GNAT family N-acetyltransferase [Candidatus Poribacteria bacterium]|nr:GNAT family N-acetyltransferase [Candidatus Poribacteria bacterium]
MEILPYTPDMVSSVTAFYNRLTTDVPHCYPVDEKEFAHAMRGVTDKVKDSKILDSEAAFVTMKRGSVLGFAHVGIGQIGDYREVEVGIIRFLGYERGARHAGQAVLEEAEAYLQACNLAQIFAFSADCVYPFYHLEYACLSDVLDHVHALFGFNGYRRHMSEVFLNWTDFSVTLTPSKEPITLTVNWEQKEGEERPNCDVFAHLDGKQVGVCESVSGGRFSRHADAQDWLVTIWLDVYGAFQGQGIGRHLLQRSLQEMHNVGYRHAAVSTNGENYRALLFYGNCGYRVADWTYEYHKKLGLN